MKSEFVDPRKHEKELKTGLLIHGIGGALAGAFSGVFIAVFFKGPLGDLLGFPVQWWHGGLIGSLVGGVAGLWRIGVEAKKISRLEEHSLALGLEPLAGADRGMIASRIEKQLHSEVTYISAFFNENEFANIVTGDVRLTHRSRSNEVGEQGQTRHSMHSYVYVRFDGHNVANFRLVPETVLRRVGDKFQRRDIDFDDSPGFSRMYHLESKSEKECRSLFNHGVRRELERDPKWEIYGHKSWLIFFRRKRFRSAEDQRDYLNDCLVVADLFHESLSEQSGS